MGSISGSQGREKICLKKDIALDRSRIVAYIEDAVRLLNVGDCHDCAKTKMPHVLSDLDGGA